MSAVLVSGGPRAKPSMSRPSQAASLNKSQLRTGRMNRSFQDFFQARWQEFLRANFHTPEQIGVAFGVSAVTATNWLNGTTTPRGVFVALAFKDYPEQAGNLIEDRDEAGKGADRSGSRAAARGGRLAKGQSKAA